MSQVIMYNTFERLWHWTLAVLILILLLTGFNIHGTYQIFNFEQAVNIHIVTAWLLMGLLVFIIFWHMTTGEWKQYIPSSTNNLIAVMKYYAIDIFMGGGHPHHKTRKEKLNPMQRMAYLSLHIGITPAIWISGLLYLYYPSWDDIGRPLFLKKNFAVYCRGSTDTGNSVFGRSHFCKDIRCAHLIFKIASSSLNILIIKNLEFV